MTGARRTVSGIVLAGGRSSRFGASKLDADLAGMTVLERTIEALRPVADQVIVVGREGLRPDVRFVPDLEAFGGPLIGLAAGLDAVASDIVLVVGGDMPLVRAGVLRVLVERTEGGNTAAVLDDGTEPRPLPMALRRDAALIAAAQSLAAGERSLRAFLARLSATIVRLKDWRALDPDGDSLLDIDSPEDLERARRRLPG